MATILDKDITRETSVKVDGREILITLTEQQTILFKLKGMKSGEVSIPIETVYKQLAQTQPDLAVVKRVTKADKNEEEMLVSVQDLRSAFNIKKVDVGVTVLFDTFFCDYIKQQKELRKK